MFPKLGRKETSARAVGLPRYAEVILTTFARENRGLFILDGPAIGTNPDASGNTLDVFCIFAKETLPTALSIARKALASVNGIEAHCYSGSDFDGTLINFLSQRGKVLGERRRRSR